MKKIRTIGCQEAISNLFSYLENDLNPTRKDEIENHLDACRTCFSRAEFEKKLKSKLEDTGEESAPDKLKSRIKDILKRY